MKKILTIISTLLLSTAIFAQTTQFTVPEDMYKDAPAEIKMAVAECDNLISQAKYASALRALGLEDQGKDEDYLIYKRTEVLTNWFCFSLMHTMFDIKDFESVDELMQYRNDISNGNKNMSFNMTFRDKRLDETADEYIKKYGETPRVALAKAQFYFDVLQRYGSQWLMSPGELMNLSFENYKKAIEGGFFDFTALNRYAESALFSEHFDEAYDAFKSLVAIKTDNGNLWFNLSSTCMYLSRYDEAAIYAQNAITYPEEVEEYQLDAYILLADAYEYSANFDKAFETLNLAVEKFPNYTLPRKHLGELNYKLGNKEKADEVFYQYINLGFLGFSNGYGSQELLDVVRFYFSVNDADAAMSIIERCETLFKGNSNALGDLYFIKAQIYFAMNNRKEASNCINKAEKLYKKAKNQDGIKNLYDFKYSYGL